MTIIYFLFLFLFLFICLITCGVILMQESKSSGLGASFGGDSGDSLFGTSTPEVLKKITSILVVIFLSGCVILSLWTSALGRTRNGNTTQSEFIER
jgi:preprotein translocase subunit SecG